MSNLALLAESDVILGKVMLEIPMPVIDSTHDVFHDLMSCVIEQQIHYRSTKKVFQRMLDAANLTRLTLDNFHKFEEKAFPTAKIADAKAETINRILAFWAANDIDWLSLNEQEVTAQLTSIKGIGQWTIDMILFYTLGRENVFPCDDFHLKQIMVSLYGLNEKVKLKAQMLAVAAAWGEQKSLATLYLLAYKKSRKELF